MIKKPSRPVSNASRLWVAFGNLWPPFCNQMVIEGSGTIDYDRLREAVDKASAANPGSRLVFRGSLSRSRWVDSGQCPGVRAVDGSGWSGNDPEGASFLEEKVDIRSGPTCEVLLVKGSPPRIVVRTHHAVMDGRGTMTWVEDIFRVLRGEKPVGSEYLAIEDDFLNVSDSLEKPLVERYISPAGEAGAGTGFTWRRKKFEGLPSLLLPRVMLLTAAEAWRTNQGKVRIGVPVDLRARRPGFRSTSNLSNAIFFDFGRDETPESVSEKIKERLKKQQDGSLTWEDKIMKYIPVSLLEKALASETTRAKKSGLYRYSAFISNLGRVSLDIFSTQSYRADTVFFIPPGNEFTPFFLTISGTVTGFEIILTMPVSHGGNGRIDEIMERIARKLNT